ncbi:MAG: restriction endonuclease subunit S [Candidatus Ratteibacteria bacterium]|jgi:type I restriction enzyme S subunit
MIDLNCVKIEEVCSIEKGSTGLAKALPGKYPLVTTGAERKTSSDYQFDAKAICIPLVSSTGHGKKTLNYVHYQEGKFALGSILVALIPKDEKVLNARYLHVYLQKNKDRVIVPLMKGAANVSLSVKAISSIEIPLPSARKQEEILNKIDSIFNEHRDLLSESDVQMNLFGQLRQAVLQEAIEGKLTADWRKQNLELISGENHASKLLETIRVEKNRLIKEGKLREEKALPPITDAEKPFALPDGWAWCRLGDVTNYGQTEKARSINNETWVLDLEDIEKGSSALLQRVSYKDRNSLSEKNIFYKNYVLYGKLRPYLDKVLVAPEDGVATTELIPIRCFNELSPHYLRLTLKAKSFIQYAISKVSGMKMPRLGTKDARRALIPMAPNAEQSVIEERANRITSSIADLETQVSECKEQSELLMQSVLREAFEHSHI